MAMGQAWTGNIVKGNARAHFGNHYGDNYYVQAAEADLVEKYLRTLRWTDCDLRWNAIRSIESDQACQWLFENAKYRAWEARQDASPFLMIKGHPGSGKSVGLKQAVKRLNRLAEDNTAPRTPVTLHYFFDGRQGTDSTLGMYRTIMYQLISQTLSLPVAFAKRFSTRDQSYWTIEKLELAFEDLLACEDTKPREVTLIIDAIDECKVNDDDGAERMLKYLQRLSRNLCTATTSLHICLSVRHVHYLGSHLTFEDEVTITVEADNVRDIQTVLSHDLDFIENTALRESLSRKMLDEAHGIFQWVDLVLRTMKQDRQRDLCREEDLTNLLDDLPKDLSVLYMHLLDKTKDPRRLKELIHLLRLVLVAREPLRSVEVQHALDFNRDGKIPKTWDEFESGVLPDHQFANRITALTHGLVQIESSRSTEAMEEEVEDSQFPVVRFMRQTVRDFLLSDQGLARLSSTRPLDLMAECHYTWLHLCMQALQLRSPNTREHNRQPRLLQYATRFWMAHAREADIILSKQGHEYAPFFLSCKTSTKKHLKSYCDTLYRSMTQHAHHLRLEAGFFVHLAAEGCTHLLMLHIKKCDCHLNDQGPPPRILDRALYHACTHGRLDMVKFLVELGANVNAVVRSNSALYFASWKGAVDLARLLLELGAAADLELPNQAYTFPLNVAVALGRGNVVRVLLERKDTRRKLLYLQNSEEHTALHYAALHNRREEAEVLLDEVDDPQAYVAISTSNGISAVEIARYHGHHEMAADLEEILES